MTGTLVALPPDAVASTLRGSLRIRSAEAAADLLQRTAQQMGATLVLAADAWSGRCRQPARRAGPRLGERYLAPDWCRYRTLLGHWKRPQRALGVFPHQVKVRWREEFNVPQPMKARGWLGWPPLSSTRARGSGCGH